MSLESLEELLEFLTKFGRLEENLQDVSAAVWRSSGVQLVLGDILYEPQVNQEQVQHQGPHTGRQIVHLVLAEDSGQCLVKNGLN